MRFRTDGVPYQPIRPLPRRLQQAVTSRIKIMGRLDIAEKRLPQDGRIVLKIAGKDYDCRLSTMPTQFGERCGAAPAAAKPGAALDRAHRHRRRGLSEAMQRLSRRSNGIILVTGPTGSGKTTTLYAALADINTPDLNIITDRGPGRDSARGHRSDRGASRRSV